MMGRRVMLDGGAHMGVWADGGLSRLDMNLERRREGDGDCAYWDDISFLPDGRDERCCGTHLCLMEELSAERYGED